MSQYSVALVVNHQTGVAGLSITKENGKRPGQYRQHCFSIDTAERIATANGKFKLDNPELNGANDTAAVWVQDVQHEFFRRLVARDNPLIFNGGVVYDAKDSRTHSIKGYGDRTEFLFIVKGVEGDSIADHALDVLKTHGQAGCEILGLDANELIDGGADLCYMSPEEALEELERSEEPAGIRLEAALEVLRELAPHYTKVADALSDAGVQLVNEIEANAQEEPETDSRLEDLYEQLRDIREGYYGNDLSGAIEKLYHQVIDMMEGN
jgi:hypothetical protein|nr:MAG TPA: hypothetical protein [Caudoviricetes sp.]